MEQAKGGPAANALVIDGKALTHALAADLKQPFLDVGPRPALGGRLAARAHGCMSDDAAPAQRIRLLMSSSCWTCALQSNA